MPVLLERETRPASSRGVEEFLRHQREAGVVYHELRPAADLEEFVACGWVSVVAQGSVALPAPVIPDGCSDIITCDDGLPVLVGPDTGAHWPSMGKGAVITGLRFRPGALRAVMGFPAPELVDTTVRLSDLFPAVTRLHARLSDVDTLRGRLTLLEEWVRSRLRRTPRDLSVIRACHTLAMHPGADIGSVAAAFGWSHRKVHREFTAACGYGPKTMQRILRVQHTTRIARRSRQPLRLSALAATGGFADQAHMTREFRSLTGLTPAQYLALSAPGLGRWLDTDWREGPQ